MEETESTMGVCAYRLCRSCSRTVSSRRGRCHEQMGEGIPCQDHDHGRDSQTSSASLRSIWLSEGVSIRQRKDFVSDRFKQFPENKRIAHKLSAPYHPPTYAV